MSPKSQRAFGLLMALAIVIASGPPAEAATIIYVYESKAGAKLITDQKRSEPGYRLVKIYGAPDNGSAMPAGTLSSSTTAPREPMPSFYDDLIHTTARKHRVDHHLVKAVMQIESGFNNFARSRAGAQGLMQLMPGTADRYGVTNVFDARANIDGAVRYLRDLLTQFNNDRRLALAGYNAGENAVVRHGGIPPYSETVQYVSQVLELHRKYQALSKEKKPPLARLALADKRQDVALNVR